MASTKACHTKTRHWTPVLHGSQAPSMDTCPLRLSRRHSSSPRTCPFFQVPKALDPAAAGSEISKCLQQCHRSSGSYQQAVASLMKVWPRWSGACVRRDYRWGRVLS